MTSTPTTTPAPAGYEDPAAVRSALKFFIPMAFIVGVGLLVLVLEMILKHRYNNTMLDWWPMPHGFIYMVYLAATARLGLAAGWSLIKMLGVMLAGCVPFLSFWVERKVSNTVKQRLAASPQ